MNWHELKLLVFALAAIALLAVSLFGMPWFRVTVDGSRVADLDDNAPRVLHINYDLDSAKMCPVDGVCVSIALEKATGNGADGWRGGRIDSAFTWYVWVGGIALWLGRALLVIVAVQTGLRLLFQRSMGLLTLVGVFSLVWTFVCGFLAAYVFADTGSATGENVTVTIVRTPAPILLLGGAVLALFALVLARRGDDGALARRPVQAVGGEPRFRPLSASPPQPVGPPVADASRARRPSRLPDSIPLDDTPGSERPLADVLRGKVRHVAAVIGVSRSGLDGLSEDKKDQREIPWSRITGIAARQLPASAPFHGVTFVDIVSTPGATLRLMPWTQIVGEEILGTPEERARVFAEQVMSRCPGAQVDAATRSFIQGERPALQLADPAMLDDYDRQLG